MAGSESDLLFYILWLAICGKFSLINLKQKQKQKKKLHTLDQYGRISKEKTAMLIVLREN